MRGGLPLNLPVAVSMYVILDTIGLFLPFTGVSNSGHLGGAIAGWAFINVVWRRSYRSRFSSLVNGKNMLILSQSVLQKAPASSSAMVAASVTKEYMYCDAGTALVEVSIIKTFFSSLFLD